MKFHTFGSDPPFPVNCKIQKLKSLNTFYFKIYESLSILMEIPSFSKSILRLDIIDSKSTGCPKIKSALGKYPELALHCFKWTFSSQKMNIWVLTLQDLC